MRLSETHEGHVNGNGEEHGLDEEHLRDGKRIRTESELDASSFERRIELTLKGLTRVLSILAFIDVSDFSTV